MGLFDGFNIDDKIRTVNLELNTCMMNFYTLLMQLGIDPDSFDETTWDEPLDMGGAPRGRVRYYIDLITALKVKKAELENE